MKLPFIEPYRIKTIEEINFSTREEREKWIEDAEYNLFNLQSNQVIIDLLTDSGTGAMSDKQWAEMMTGDESYAGSSSFKKLKDTVEQLTGFPYLLPTHQGRAAENVLFSVLVKEGHIIPGNTHFDTTKGHIEFRKAHAVDCTIDEAFSIDDPYPFKGNIDIEKLEKIYQQYGKEKIPFTLITITCNSSGGQPVSIENIRAVKALSERYNIPIFFDAARFAENAFFIKEREKEFHHQTIKEICKEMFSYADGMTMSSKKDGLVNIGGFLALKNEELYQEAGNFGIIYEGYLTYGGLAGRDLAALAQGLQESTEHSYLQARIGQVIYLGEKLRSYGIPVQYPIGGHAVFVDALGFYPHLKRDDFPAQTLGIELYKEAGVRGVEIGTLLADRDPETRENRYPALELLRLAIPRRTYTQNHMDYIAKALKNVFDRREEVTKGYSIAWEAPILRHFTVKLKKK
ncbi:MULTISPECIES: tryptophanase [Weeksella]|uniref:Tryptophanase n=1 Tax=Weeksella virosa (strain ATCC 43766 / DSM 16922 / JCM 21250 / CCUG 30538 / CDC 9751 / IAM 14551 / NBRC 16016 / NCTC 11634 / CL345/78) TaxID=865938 RepID=F0P2B3_WEEVC|nr:MULTISPECIES: tryptophanase [Weeksella]ADX67803.1 Tryptophanase [Weeksella virosa DSM 16922]MDK7374092.1 tryptophanase [Weeksella virosa]MDK7674347.1 tryptophanase [Weeksella virosa]OFM82775.1 tyrosine phenol-lyase [Weeksella sp. HMSC059D05]SUP54103.1 Tyrosine phenol-lyase [Weeksella virosa]